MEFKAEYQSYITRYWGGFAALLLIIYGFFVHWVFKDFSLTNLLKEIFLSGNESILFSLVVFLIFQISGYISTNKRPKVLELAKDSLTFRFFKKPSLTLKYSEIESLEYTKDIFKNFEFTLKNGEKKMIYSTLSDNKKAFEEINKKIKESKS